MPILQKITENGVTTYNDTLEGHVSTLVFGLGDLTISKVFEGESNYGSNIGLDLVQLEDPIEVGTEVDDSHLLNASTKASFVFHRVESLDILINWLNAVREIAIEKEVFKGK